MQREVIPLGGMLICTVDKKLWLQNDKKNKKYWVKIWNFQLQGSFVVLLVSQHGGIANFAPSHQFDFLGHKPAIFATQKAFLVILLQIMALLAHLVPHPTKPSMWRCFTYNGIPVKITTFGAQNSHFAFERQFLNQIMHTGYSYNRASTCFICNLQKIDFKIPSTA